MVNRPKKFGKRRFKDQRDWRRYNEELVVRGTFFLDLAFAENWERELAKMNRGKRGAPFQFPRSFVAWLAVWHQLVDYRGLEGISRKLAEKHVIPYFEDYTTAWHRLHSFRPTVRLPSFRELNTATDGTGLKRDSRGSYREFMYGRRGRKKYLVVVLTVDVKHKKLLDVDAYVEGHGPSEPEVAMKHAGNLMNEGYQLVKFSGDGKFDTNDMFDFWDRYRVKCAIPPRANAKIRLTRSERRKHEIRMFRRWRYRKWRRLRGYGDRLAVECENSAVKREFGEGLSSKRGDCMVAEAVQRFWAYDLLKSYGAGEQGI